jgi:hypothetical protein
VARGDEIAKAAEDRLGPALASIDAAVVVRTSATETEAGA